MQESIMKNIRDNSCSYTQNISKNIPPLKLITKKVMIKDIMHIENIIPRQKINDERLSLFEELLKDDEIKVENIILLPLQSGDTDNIKYAILEGLHRYTAYKNLGVKEITANIITGYSYTVKDIEEDKIKAELLSISVPFNAITNLPISKQDMEKTSIFLWKNNFPITKIASLFSIPYKTVQRWLYNSQEGISRVLKKSELKNKTISLIRNGASIKAIHRQTGYDRKTIRKLKNNINSSISVNQENRRGGKYLICPKSPPSLNSETTNNDNSRECSLNPHIDNTQLRSDESYSEYFNNQTDNFKDTLMLRLCEICNEIKSTPWCSEADDFVIKDLFNVLSLKSDTLREVFEPQGLRKRFTALKADYDNLLNEFNKLSRKHQEDQSRITELISKIKSFGENCGRGCKYIQEEKLKIIERNLSSYLEILTQYKTAINDKYINSINGGEKVLIAIDNNSIHAHCQFMHEFVYRCIGNFEMAVCYCENLTKIYESYKEFVSMLKELNLDKRADISQRLSVLNIHFENYKHQCSEIVL